MQNNTQTNLERYDPVFILRFSIYCLSVGYIEPMEFASLGLLAIAFVSMSSPDEGIRRLAYNTLEKFMNALEVKLLVQYDIEVWRFCQNILLIKASNCHCSNVKRGRT